MRLRTFQTSCASIVPSGEGVYKGFGSEAKDMKEMVIWRKIIYRNDFKCRCGAQLLDVDKNEPTDNVGMNADNPDGSLLFCTKCHFPVGLVAEYDPSKNVMAKEF